MKNSEKSKFSWKKKSIISAVIVAVIAIILVNRSCQHDNFGGPDKIDYNHGTRYYANA